MSWFLTNIFKSLVLFGVIYFWNKYIVVWVVSRVPKFHRRHNPEMLEKFPIIWFINNEKRIIKFGQYFYWIGYIMILFGIWTEK